MTASLSSSKDVPVAFFLSLAGVQRAVAMIIVSEIGDKTFLLAALLAMRHSRLVVFTGAFLALAVMSVLSAGLGHLLPTLVSRQYTVLAASGLFLVFGAKMFHEGVGMEGGTNKVKEEIKEVEDEIKTKVDQPQKDQDSIQMELGNLKPSSRPLTGHHKAHKRRNSHDHGLKNLVYLLISPVLIQTFVMTFLAEWGDRSQISTIALAAAHNVYLVTAGTVLGHGLCTFLAVMGGRWLATKISVKHVTLGGATLFLMFGFLYLYEGIMWNRNERNHLSVIETVTERAGKPNLNSADSNDSST